MISVGFIRDGHLHTGKKVMGHVANQGQRHKDRTEDEAVA